MRVHALLVVSIAAVVQMLDGESLLGGGTLVAGERVYIALVVLADDDVEIYINGELAGFTQLSWSSPSSEAVFVRDDSTTSRSDNAEAIVDAIRISDVDRFPGEIDVVQARLNGS